MIKKIFSFIPVLIWAGVIFSFSAISVPKASQIYWQDFVFKKLAHLGEYFIFCTLIYRALKISTNLNKVDVGFYAILFTVLYAFSDEFHQSFTPGREPTVRDIIFDTIGALGGVFFIWKLLPKMPKKLKNLAETLQFN